MAMDAQPAGIPAAVWLATFKYAPANLISFLLRFSKTQPLQDQLPGLQISRWTIATIRQGVPHYMEQAWSAHHCDRSLSSDQE
jgi:hypothetical protein